MKKILIFLLISTHIIALQLGLNDIEKELEKTHPFYFQIKEKRALQNVIIKSEYAEDPFILSSSGAKAYQDVGDSEFEYSLGVSKTYLLSGYRSKKINIAQLKNKAEILHMQKEAIKFSNSIKLAYHQSCLNSEQRESFEKFVNEFKTLFKKKLKAYQYKDISKRELLQLKIEKADLIQKLENLKAKESISEQALRDLFGGSEKDEFACTDLYEMVFKVDDTDKIFGLTKEQYEQKIEAINRSKVLYEKKLKSIDLSIGYDNEIGIKRYGVGFDLPLSFTSSKNEHEKIAVLHREKLLKLQRDNILIDKNIEFKRLKSQLKNEKNIIFQTQNNIKSFKTELLPLIEISYQLGESSVVEYLLSKQKLWHLQESLSEHKQNYYKTLFELFIVTEIKDTK